MKKWGDSPTTDQFSHLEIVRRRPQIGYEAWIAVYFNDGKHVAISAPTLDRLSEVFAELTGLPLQRERAQHVVIISYVESDSEASSDKSHK